MFAVFVRCSCIRECLTYLVHTKTTAAVSEHINISHATIKCSPLLATLERERERERERETANMTSDHEEDTNLDEDLRRRLVEGRVLPNPEATAAVGECNSVELEHYMAGLQQQLTAHIRWLRTNRAHWGSLQRSLIHEFQVALNGGAILQWMLSQAMLFARGLPPPNHPRLADPYPPRNPGEAR